MINEYNTVGNRIRPPFTSIVKYDRNEPRIAWRIGFGDDPELAARGITANAVAPGYIETAMTAVLDEKQRDAMLGQIPLARPGSDEDIAAAVKFLASDEAGYITGHVLDVNGGMYM